MVHTKTGVVCFCGHLSCPAAKLQNSHPMDIMDQRPLLLTSSTYSASSTYLTSWKQRTGFDHLLYLGNIQHLFVFGSSIHGLASLMARIAPILSSTPPSSALPISLRSCHFIRQQPCSPYSIYLGQNHVCWCDVVRVCVIDRPSSSVTPVAASDPYKSKTAQISSNPTEVSQRYQSASSH